MLEAAVAVTVASNVGSAIPDRLCRCAPEIAGYLVANVERFAARVSDRIVRPRRELVLAAVSSPGVAAPLRRHLKPEVGIGDHVDPRRRRGMICIEDDHVFPAVLVKAAKAVEEFKVPRRRRWPRRRYQGLMTADRRWRGRRLR
jgi:hypothetical protein